MEKVWSADDIEEQQRLNLVWKRVGIAVLLAVLLHLLFFFVIAPLIRMGANRQERTTVEEISSDDLAKLKQQILKNQQLTPLLEQELHEKYKTKAPPKDAQFIGKFNQTVDEETVAGPQNDTPENGGGGGAKARAKETQKKLDLSRLGLGSKVLPPVPDEAQPSETAGPPGPKGPYRPVGRDDPRLKKSHQNMLNAVESEYYSFFARFEEPIIRNWFFLANQNNEQLAREIMSKKHRPGDEIPVTVEFVLNRKGVFESVKIIESSGLPTLDHLTLEAVRKLGTLENPPPGVFEGRPYFTYRARFSVVLSEGAAFRGGPGLSWY